jgi:hypothetical protein
MRPPDEVKAWREAERARLIAGRVALPVERVRTTLAATPRRPLAVGIGHGFQRMPTIYP